MDGDLIQNVEIMRVIIQNVEIMILPSKLTMFFSKLTTGCGPPFIRATARS